ncbi:MAG: peroxiredoxin [Phycisphaerales bacterium]|jgi:peroxiredoxin
MFNHRRRTVAQVLAIAATPVLALAQSGATPPSEAPPEIKAPEATPPQATAKTVRELEAKTGLPIGWGAPAVGLKNAKGETVELAELYTLGPTVVAFYRGGWCPFCSRQLTDWQEYAQDFEDAGVNVVFITPESVENVNGSIEKTETTFTVLSDSDQQAAQLFNVIFALDAKTRNAYKGYGIDLQAWNANAQWKLPVPGVFLIDTEGVVRWQSIDENYKVRVDPETVLEAVAEL